MAAMLVAAGAESGKIWDDTVADRDTSTGSQAGDGEASRATAAPGDTATPSLPGFSAGSEGASVAAAAHGSTLPVTGALSGLGGRATQAGGSGGGEGPPPVSSPAAGVPSTCHACSEPRVSRTITCQGCHETFHWSCIGFYEHKYQKPWVNWRCKACRGGEAAPQEATAPAKTPGRDATVLEPGSSKDKLPEGASPTSLPVAAQAPAGTGSGDRVCPVCGKDIGRKRTIDCSVCNTPSHASCVNVRGAETPKQWVCSRCRAKEQGETGDGGNGTARVSNANGSRAAEAAGEGPESTAPAATLSAAGKQAGVGLCRVFVWTPDDFVLWSETELLDPPGDV